MAVAEEGPKDPQHYLICPRKAEHPEVNVQASVSECASCGEQVWVLESLREVALKNGAIIRCAPCHQRISDNTYYLEI